MRGRRLKNGLKLEAELGVNPYKFGMVGSTDAHTGLAAVEEDNFFGKTSSSEPSADPSRPILSFRDPRLGLTIMGWETTASGYAAVWAAENTRAVDLRRHGAARDLRHHRTAHGRSLLRRLRLRRRGRQHAQPGLRRLHQGRADGRRPRPGAGGQGADLPRRRAQGPDRRQSRPLPDRQGLARRRGQRPRAGL